MKFKLLVKDSNGKILHEPTFATLKEAEEGKIFCEDIKNYPQFPLKKVVDKEEVAKITPAVKAVIDKDGTVISEATPEIKIVVSAEESHLENDYTVEIQDKSEQVDAEKAERVQKEQKKFAATDALKVVDVDKLKSIEEIKPILKMILDKLLN